MQRDDNMKKRIANKAFTFVNDYGNDWISNPLGIPVDVVARQAGNISQDQGTKTVKRDRTFRQWCDEWSLGWAVARMYRHWIIGMAEAREYPYPYSSIDETIEYVQRRLFDGEIGDDELLMVAWDETWESDAFKDAVYRYVDNLLRSRT
jgi:hypothetical protein